MNTHTSIHHQFVYHHGLLETKRGEIERCIHKFPGWVDNKIYTYLWYYSLLSHSKGYSDKTHWLTK